MREGRTKHLLGKVVSNLKNMGIKKILGLVALLFCVLISMIYIYTSDIRKSFLNQFVVIDNLNSENEKSTISAKNPIKQYFYMDTNIDRIILNINTYNRVNIGKTIIKIKDGDGKAVLFEKEFSNKDISENETGLLEVNVFPVIKCSEKERFILEISSEEFSQKRHISFGVRNIADNSMDKLTINNETKKSFLGMQVCSGTGSFMGKYYWGICAFIIFILIVGYYLCFIGQFKIERVFLFASITIGILYSILLTPFSVPDEKSHFETTYRYSNVLMFKGDMSDDKTIKFREGDLGIYEYDLYPNPITYEKQVKTMFELSDNNKEIDNEITSVGNFLLYIPAAIGMSVARLFNLGFTPLIYFARLFNLLFYSIVLYFGIRKIPFSKTLIGIIGLLPISLQQGMSCSYDAVIVSTAIFVICYFLNAIYSDDNITKKDFILLTVMCAVLSAAKYGVYFPIVLLSALVILKYSKEKKKKVCRGFIGIILVSIIFTIIFNISNVLPVISKSTANISSENVVSSYSIMSIIKDPVYFIKTVIRTFLLHKDDYFKQVFGANLGYMKITVSIIIIFIFAVLVLVSALKTEEDKIEIKKSHKCWFLLMSFCMIGILWAAAFTWNEVGSRVIEGMQGRYLLPMLPLIVLCIRNNMIVIKERINKYIMYIALILHGLVLLDLLRFVVTV